jgi:integrase
VRRISTSIVFRPRALELPDLGEGLAQLAGGDDILTGLHRRRRARLSEPLPIPNDARPESSSRPSSATSSPRSKSAERSYVPTVSSRNGEQTTVLPDYLRDFTRLAYLTGWRKSEIVSLRWTVVDCDAGAIRLRPEAAKTGRGRTVMLEADLAELIDRRWEARLLEKNGNVRVAGLVFHRDGEPVGDFRKAWATACEVAGVPDKLFHDLRRTAARNMVRAGVPERVAMAVTGHVTRSMIDRYNIVSEDDLRMATQKTTMYVDRLPTTRVPG